MGPYVVNKLKKYTIEAEVPSSKSILSRAILLAAFTEGDTLLRCGRYGEDTLALLGCLNALGIGTEESAEGILVHGRRRFERRACLNVGSAGTAARFLTPILAFLGGEYELNASSQMEKRPMEILPVLQDLGVEIEYIKETGHFPFRMRSKGISDKRIGIGTDVSTQYASGLMLAAALGQEPLELTLSGGRTDGSYLKMTAAVIRSFGGGCMSLPAGTRITISPIGGNTSEYLVEPDVSGACYFYALSLLMNATVTVKDVHFGSLQGDIKFLELLREKGVRLTDGEHGIVADGSRVPFYNGFDTEMTDFSDQTMTAAVLAAFAGSPSILRGVSHIRSQECDRVNAILKGLHALGIGAFEDGNDIFIEPAPARPCKIETFGDHRVAMAFALAGMKLGGVEIDDPDCCKKTFPNYFEIVRSLTE